MKEFLTKPTCTANGCCVPLLGLLLLLLLLQGRQALPLQRGSPASAGMAAALLAVDVELLDSDRATAQL